jgi:hypothetical protein
MATSAPLDDQIGRFTCVELADTLDRILDGAQIGSVGSEAVRFRRLDQSKSSRKSTWGSSGLEKR